MASTRDTPAPAATLAPDFSFTIDFPRAQTLIATGVITLAQGAEILQDATAAAADWARFIGGQRPLRISIDIAGLSANYLAVTNDSYEVPIGALDGKTLMQPASAYVLNTGQVEPGTSSDVTITLGSGYLSALYLNPDPSVPSAVPANEYDLVTILRHEMGHGLGMVGYLGTPNPTQETLFDRYVRQNPDGTAFFTGPTAELVYGGPVPLTTANNGEQLYHLGNASSDPASQDLMRGLGLPPGQTIEISPLDLAIMKDIGEPVLAQGVSPGGVVCFARGTRLAGPKGEQLVECLAIGDPLLTASGRVRRIVWIGRRHIDCARHPDPRAVWPVRIRAHAFGPGLPGRDLLLSPQHAIFAKGVLIPVKCLANGGTVRQEARRSVAYFHVELDRHDILLAEGLPAESYLDTGDRALFENGGAALVLHPDFARLAWEAGAYAALKVMGPEVEALRARLAERAQGGGVADQVDAVSCESS